MKLRGASVWIGSFLLVIGLSLVVYGNPVRGSGEAAGSVAASAAGGAGSANAAPVQSGGPAWWPADLALPAPAQYRGEANRMARWESAENLDAAAGAFQKQAAARGYQVFKQIAEPGQNYALFVMKAGSAFRLDLDHSSGGTAYLARRVGVMHVKTAGAAAVEFDMPLTGIPYTITEGHFNIASRAPSGSCDGCQYLVNINVYPYDRPGAYISTDALFSLGQSLAGDDYSGAQVCTVTVKDSWNGSYDCKGLQNQADQAKTLDVSGTWQIPQG